MRVFVTIDDAIELPERTRSAPSGRGPTGVGVAPGQQGLDDGLADHQADQQHGEDHDGHGSQAVPVGALRLSGSRLAVHRTDCR